MLRDPARQGLAEERLTGVHDLLLLDARHPGLPLGVDGGVSQADHLID
jgi:hypothetical protein